MKWTLLAAVVGVATGALVAGGLAFATVPGTDGKVWACYGNNEALRVFDKEAGETCRGTELALLGASAKAADADMLDGLDSSAFYAAGSKVADADTLDGLDSTSFLSSNLFGRLLVTTDVYRDGSNVTVPPNTTQSIDMTCSRSLHEVRTIDPAISGGIAGLDATTRLEASHAYGGDTGAESFGLGPRWRWTFTTGANADSFAVQVTCLHHN